MIKPAAASRRLSGVTAAEIALRALASPASASGLPIGPILSGVSPVSPVTLRAMAWSTSRAAPGTSPAPRARSSSLSTSTPGRAAPGGANARLTRWARRAWFTIVPSISTKAATGSTAAQSACSGRSWVSCSTTAPAPRSARSTSPRSGQVMRTSGPSR